jgi:hypothetical protein
MNPTTGLDVLRAVASDPAGMVGEELLHELGFDGTEAAIAVAETPGWIERDSDDVLHVTAEGADALGSPGG